MTKEIESIRNTETGRSMVEMLGVLAIIGVLSIGGIASYRYALDKAAANAILDGVQKRAVVASQQLINGATAVTLKEFHPNTNDDMIEGYVVTPSSLNGSLFTLTVDGIPESVCNKVIKNPPRQAIDVYIGTAGVTDCAEENNSLTFQFSSTLDGNAQPAQPAEPSATPQETCTVSTEDCQCVNGVCEQCPEGQIWDGTQCREKKTEGCEVNKDCESGQYCQINADWDNYDNCYKGVGTCVDKGNKPNGVTVEGIGTLYAGNEYMTWWSANNWCRAHGLKLFSPTASMSGWCQPYGLNGSTDYAYGDCYLPNNFPGKDTYDYYWTGNGYDSPCTTSGCNSCNAFYVLADLGFVDYSGLYNFHYPLCE